MGSPSPQHVASLNGQQSSDPTLPFGEEKETHGRDPMALRVARHDPKRQLKDLIWSEAKVWVFVSHREPHPTYRIGFYRDEILFTNYSSEDILFSAK